MNLIDYFPLEIHQVILFKLGPTIDYYPMSLTCKFYHNLVTLDSKFVQYHQLVKRVQTKHLNDKLSDSLKNLINELFAYVKDKSKHAKEKDRHKYFSNGGFNTGEIFTNKKKYVSISWWEFLFIHACILGNDVCINLLVDYPIISLYQQNLHLGFVKACVGGHHHVVQQLYTYGKSIDLDLFYCHFCVSENNIFCPKKTACETCDYNVFLSDASREICIENDCADVLKWCVEISTNPIYQSITVVDAARLCTIDFADSDEEGTVFIQSCRGNRINIAHWIYKYNVDNGLDIQNFSCLSFYYLCHNLIHWNSPSRKIIELLLNIFVTHHDTGITMNVDMPVYHMYSDAENSHRQILNQLLQHKYDGRDVSRDEVIQQTIDLLLSSLNPKPLLKKQRNSNNLPMYPTILQFCIDHQIKLSRETLINACEYQYPRITPRIHKVLQRIFTVWIHDEYFTKQDYPPINLAYLVLAYHHEESVNQHIPNILNLLSDSKHYILSFPEQLEESFGIHLQQLCVDDNIALIKSLLKISLDYNYYKWLTMARYIDLLTITTNNGSLGITKLFLQYRDQIKYVHTFDSKYDQFPLLEACCKKGSPDLVEWICMNRDMDLTKKKDLAFCTACYHNQLEVAQTLIDICNKPPNHPIDLSSQDWYAFKIVCQNGNLQFAKWIYQISLMPGFEKIPIKEVSQEIIESCELYGHERVIEWIKSM